MRSWSQVEPDKYCLVGSHRYTKGRSRPIDRIVIHHNAANNWTAEQVRDLWNNSREASAHYQVESDGTIAQLVNDSDTAWHAANADINARSIGIEHANISGPPRWQISDETIEEGAHLVAALCRFYKLGRPQWGVNVFPHSQFTSTSCPYQLNVGGEDHDTYMRRAAYWYDHPQSEQKTTTPTPKEELDMNAVQELKDYIDKRLTGPVGQDVKDIRQQITGGRDGIPGDLAASYPGWDVTQVLNNVRTKGYNHLTLIDLLVLSIYGTDADHKLAAEVTANAQ